MARPSDRLGESLNKNIAYWKEVTDNEVVLNWINEGVILPISDDPEPFFFQNKPFGQRQSVFIDEEINRLITEKCVERCEEGYAPRFVNPIQTVPKKDTFRLITDLRHLNSLCTPPKFAYENIDDVLNIVAPLDKLVTIDLKNGFFHIPVHRHYRDFLCFQWRDRFYRWCVLPFGSNVSPYYFYKVVRCVVEHFRDNGIQVVGYVDDFIVSDSCDKIEASTAWILNEFVKLGWHVNYEKSCLNPSHKAKFIGYIIETEKHQDSVWLSVPKDRLKKVKRDITRVLTKGSASARALARIAGQCISMTKAVIPAKLLLRNLYRCLKQKSNWQDTLVIDKATEYDLHWWWSALDHWNGQAFSTKCRDCVQMTTDASLEGWGSQLRTDIAQEAQGFWDLDMRGKSSNYRELMAIYLSLKSFLPNIRGKSVQVLTDNVTSAAYINFQGGQSSPLSEIATEIWSLSLQNNISIQAKHLAGHLNSIADSLSRVPSNYEW